MLRSGCIFNQENDEDAIVFEDLVESDLEANSAINQDIKYSEQKFPNF